MCRKVVSCDKAYQFSALKDISCRSYLEKQILDNKCINKRIQLFIHQMMFVSQKTCQKEKTLAVWGILIYLTPCPQVSYPASALISSPWPYRSPALGLHLLTLIFRPSSRIPWELFKSDKACLKDLNVSCLFYIHIT